MSDTLTFMMGEYKAEFPTDRRYAQNHMWARGEEGGSGTLFRFGFSAYAVRLLQDVYFLEWAIDAPTQVSSGQEIGSVESKKAESSLYAPAAGLLQQFNSTLLNDPSAINVDKYEAGWLFEMLLDQQEFLTAEQYVDFLEGVWEKTQRTIKGQMNE